MLPVARFSPFFFSYGTNILQLQCSRCLFPLFVLLDLTVLPLCVDVCSWLCCLAALRTLLCFSFSLVEEQPVVCLHLLCWGLPVLVLFLVLPVTIRRSKLVMNGPRISRVSLSWVHRFHSLSGIHGPTHFSLVHRFHIGNSSIYYLVAVGSLVLILVKFQEVMPSLVFPSRGGRIGVQHTIKLSALHFPSENSPPSSSVPSPAIF